MAPKVTIASQISPTTVRINFDSPMLNDSNLIEPSNYAFTAGSGGAPVTALFVQPEVVANPTYVDVTTNEHTDGITYTVEVSNVTDQFSALIDPFADSASYPGVGSEPQLASVDVRSSVLIRLNFSEEMVGNDDLTDPISYTITPITAGAAPVYFSSIVTPTGDAYPQWVEIPISEMTDGATYEVAVSTNGPVDKALNTVDPANNSLQFTGKGSIPGVSSVVAIGQNRADVVFDESMVENDDIKNPANYQWDNGLTTISVLGFVDNSTVQLVTSDQTEGVLYTLNINN